MLSAVMQNVVMVIVFLLSVVTLNVVRPCVVAPTNLAGLKQYTRVVVTVSN
jgi:hypothetical protein